MAWSQAARDKIKATNEAQRRALLDMVEAHDRMRKALEEIAREQSHIDATVAADRFQRIAREALGFTNEQSKEESSGS